MISNERFLELCQLYGFEVQENSKDPGFYIKEEDGTMKPILPSEEITEGTIRQP